MFSIVKRIARKRLAFSLRNNWLKIIIVFSLMFFTLYPIPYTLYPIHADEIADLQKQINDLNKAREQSVAATKPLEGQLQSLGRQLAQIQAKLDALATNIKLKQKELDKREEKLVDLTIVFNSRVGRDYKNGFLLDPLSIIFGGSGKFADKLYRLKTINDNHRIIRDISAEMMGILVDKDKLEKDKVIMASLQAQVDKTATFIGGEVKKAKAYQGDLTKKIADLSAKQQSILAARSGQFTATIGDSEEADDINASIKGFRANAPAGYFGVFSFGAHTHRKGMSQYGARGRAQSGHDYKKILKAYYGKEPVSKDTGGTIKVAGFGEMNFEEQYLWGIAEMPSSWHPEALKAQAVAARTYAYRAKIAGSEICTSEACQVFSKSKSDNSPQAWKDAIRDTRGQVIEDVVTFYASTHGGFASPIGWDTTDGSGGGNFIDKSYDKLGGSPWLYKAWYTQKYSINSDKCGRSNAWVSPEEMADIINAARYIDDRVTPVTTSCYPGTNPYSHEELRAKANGPSSVSSVSVIQGNGSTNEVIFQTNTGEIRINGADFKKAFNLRAPGRLSIPQSGFAFFNIEKR